MVKVTASSVTDTSGKFICSFKPRGERIVKENRKCTGSLVQLGVACACIGTR